ncbi:MULTISPECIES: EAL domain-containing protein [unclassified Campylobacter]|uniref:EAL domain-containing protein n=1 Tax=unclassified Campylobacter TaxID=2593542 RepID=UPI001DF44B48|nr:EAL domain-containing protein [Campylobacter sp. RM9331]MBZ8004703.1 EAL domain-containing protein [Campylobacter sp. RM9332]
MTISKKIERKNRQDAAIKLIMPLLLLVFAFVYLQEFNEIVFKPLDILVILCFIFLYFYYFVFVIYKSVKHNVIDEKTGTLLQSEFTKYLNNDDFIVFFTISNINEIKLMLGFNKSDRLLKKLIDKFYAWDENLIIGRITTADFMILSSSKHKTLQHEIKKIFLEIKRERIDGVDFKCYYSIIKSSINFNKLYLEAQNRLKDDVDVATENIITNSVVSSINKSDFFLKIQRLEGEEEIYYLNYRINSDYPEKISQAKLEEIIIKNNLEFNYYKNLLELLAKEYHFNNRIIIKISPDFLRNLNFLFYLGEYFIKHPNTNGKIIFEFFENDVYYDMPRFEEIIKEYREININFALNRIGSPSSLEYLKRLEFEFGIFDIEFNKNVKNEKYFIIYENLFNLCKSLNIKTIMRFIDNKNLLDLTKDIKFDYYQGFLFYKDKNLKEMK